MSVINCNYILDTASQYDLVSTSDSGGVDVKYFQPPKTLSQYQLMTHSYYFV
jgi:hypothetical protein